MVFNAKCNIISVLFLEKIGVSVKTTVTEKNDQKVLSNTPPTDGNRTRTVIEG
jgi:hypothetical protein